MNVSLTPELEQLIEQKLKTGMYSSASEVIRAGLRLLQEHDDIRLVQLEQLKRDLRAGLQQGKSGAVVDGEEVFKELRERNKKHKKAKR
jgi:antitoxin ParD1/3/4